MAATTASATLASTTAASATAAAAIADHRHHCTTTITVTITITITYKVTTAITNTVLLPGDQPSLSRMLPPLHSPTPLPPAQPLQRLAP